MGSRPGGIKTLVSPYTYEKILRKFYTFLERITTRLSEFGSTTSTEIMTFPIAFFSFSEFM
jgi:hypothetical protein